MQYTDGDYSKIKVCKDSFHVNVLANLLFKYKLKVILLPVLVCEENDFFII